MGDQTWLNKFYNCRIGKGWRYAVNGALGTNAGENISFIGGAFFNTNNSSGNGVALYTPAGANADIYCYGVSFDYNDIEVQQGSGTLNLIGCHIEDSSNNPMFKISYTSGQGNTVFSVNGGKLAPVGGNRSYLTEVSGDNISVNFTDVHQGLYGLPISLIKVLSGSPFVSTKGGFIEVQTGVNACNISAYNSALRNGAFELGTLVGWTTPAATFTYSAQNTNVQSGTSSLKITGTGTTFTDTSLQQSFPIRAGELLLFTGSYLLPTALTGGSVELLCTFVDSQGNEFNETRISSAITTSTTAATYTNIGDWKRVPAGAVSAKLKLRVINLNGTIYFDNFVANRL